MQPWKDEIDAVGTKVIGQTLVKLDQTTCRYSECLLGNFVADAMVYGVSIRLDCFCQIIMSASVHRTSRR
jgi:hypothetical protein